jgi:hypothetical protein
MVTSLGADRSRLRITMHESRAAEIGEAPHSLPDFQINPVTLAAF